MVRTAEPTSKKYMKTIDEFRNRQIVLLAKALARPTFYASGFCDAYFRGVLSELCWVDERNDEETKLIVSAGGPCGVLGDLLEQCRDFRLHEGHYTTFFDNEITSVYAEVSFKLGYFSLMRTVGDVDPESPSGRVGRLLSGDAYDEMIASIGPDFLQEDRTVEDVLDEFGPPSHEVLGGQTSVHCYGCADRSTPWVFFDYARCFPPSDGRTYEWFETLRLRNVRRDKSQILFVPFGRRILRAAGRSK